MQHTEPDAGGGADDDGRALCLLRTQTKPARSSDLATDTHTSTTSLELCMSE